MRYPLCAAWCLIIVSAASAYSPGDIERVEGVLSRLTLERGAFISCAGDDAQLKGFLESNWAIELKDAGELLAQHGFPEQFVGILSSRFDVVGVTRSFVSADERERFCAVLGDWQRRWELFYVSSPKIEIKKVLEQ